MVPRVVLITSNETRHKFLANYLKKKKKIHLSLVIFEDNIKLKDNLELNSNHSLKKYVSTRNRFEKNILKEGVTINKKIKFLKVKRGEINHEFVIKKIQEKKPTHVISFGCSIINSKVIQRFKNKIFLNIHLGLSPYYAGSGTNFFPFVNNELHFCGATLMKISKELDGGKIVHQIRPNFKINDNIHTVGNRIIKRIAQDLYKIILLKKINFYSPEKFNTKVFRRKDFSLITLNKALKNLKGGIIKNYLKNQNKLKKAFPIIKQI
jgi:phosphoribosylglycinamide formyltransferase 1